MSSAATIALPSPSPSGEIALMSAEECVAMKLKLKRVSAARARLNGSPGFWNNSSVAEKCHELTSTWCAPSEIVAYPRGYQCAIKPQGAAKPLSFTVDESWAKLFDRHLKAMHAGGQRPFFDFWHSEDCGQAGWPQEFFWDYNRGVCCFAEWSPAARDLILSGKCNSFSPSWSHMSGKLNDLPLGIPLRCGALLASSMKPALQRMPPIKPVLMRDSVKLAEKRMWERFEKRLPEFKARDEEFAVLECMAAVATDYPDLYQAHVLMKTLSEEFEKDIEAAY